MGWRTRLVAGPGAPIEHGEVISYYEHFDEESRLTRGSGLLEFARMQELIRRFLPPPPGVVLDVGGGPGRYSCWLARSGYEVHHVDPVRKHVKQAREASARQPDHPLASATQGDARSLDHGECCADAVLLMGPLYHLPVRDDRLAALRETRRSSEARRPSVCQGRQPIRISVRQLERGIYRRPDLRFDTASRSRRGTAPRRPRQLRLLHNRLLPSARGARS